MTLPRRFRLEALFVAVAAVVAAICLAGSQLLAAGATAQNAAAHWERVQGEMRLHLREFAITRDPAEWQAFERHLQTARAFRDVGRLLREPGASREALGRAFDGAGVPATEAARLFALIRFAQAVLSEQGPTAWQEADVCTGEMERLAGIVAGAGTAVPIAPLVRRLDGLERRCADIEDRLSREMRSRGGQVMVLVHLAGGIGILALVAIGVALRRRALRRVVESKHRFQRIIETAHEGVWVAGADGVTTYVNRRMAEMLGYRAEELVGRPCTAFLVGDVGQQAEAFFKTRTAAEAGQYDATLRRRDGGTLDAIVSVASLEPAGDAGATVAMVTDITERRRSEEALREANDRLRRSEERYRLLFDRNLAGVALTTLDGRFVEVNAAFAGILGYESPAALMNEPAEALYEGGRDARREVVSAIQREGRRSDVQLRLRHRDGRTVWATSTATLVTREGEEPLILSNLFDVSERKVLELQLRGAQRMEVVGQLAGGVAHDFNNKLMVILGQADHLMREAGHHDDLRPHLEAIRAAGARAADLTRQLLAFSRQQVLSPLVLDLGQLVADSANLVRRMVGERIRLETRRVERLWAVKADPSQVEHALMNLVVNARDAMPDGGCLTIETANVTLDETFVARHPGSRAGEYVRLRVADGGCGMDERTLAHIFEPFFTTKSPSRHSGLGLSTTYGIVKQSDGYIDVASRPGAGTCADVYLPRAQPEPAAQPARAGARAGAGAGGTVLLVEDEEGVRDLLVHALERRGYRVLVAESGEQALDICSRHRGRIDLLVSDLVMPGMSGLQTYERARQVHPEAKVIFMSGYSQEATPGLCGSYPFLGKPFSISTLVQRVGEVLAS